MNFNEENPDLVISDPISLKLLACVFYGDPFHNAEEWSYENEIGHLWNRFMNLMKKYGPILQKSFPNPNYSYELHYEPEEYAKTKRYYVYVGVEIDQIDIIPLDFVLKPLPYTKYAILNAKTKEHKKVEDFLREWTINPPSGYQQAYPYIIQRYDRRKYKGLEDPESEMEWLIPVKQL